MNKIQTSKVEIDQSVRVEELTRDTILAVANKEFQYAVCVPIRLKRQLYEMYVSFTAVGKNSPAHEKAYFALKGKRTVETTLHYSDFRVWVEAKQKDWRTVTPRVYEDSQSNQSVF